MIICHGTQRNYIKQNKYRHSQSLGTLLVVKPAGVQGSAKAPARLPQLRIGSGSGHPSPDWCKTASADDPQPLPGRAIDGSGDMQVLDWEIETRPANAATTHALAESSSLIGSTPCTTAAAVSLERR